MHNSHSSLFVLLKLLYVIPILLLTACNPSVALNPSSTPPTHKEFDALLKKFVDTSGMVDYKGLQNDRASLRAYLAILAANAPNEKWSKNEQLAYWINVYNAYTLDLILEYYPVESIKDIGSKIQIPFVNTAWDKKFIHIAGQTYDLNNIEHGIIRKQFDEPRIHFALVCAAVSCPKLLNEAFIANKLDDQLTRASKDFLSDRSKNDFKNPNEIALSQIFSWYRGDFEHDTSLIGFINKYVPIKLQESVTIKYMDYDWALNEQ